MDIPSAASGVNRPNAGVFRRTPLSAEYNIFDSERYVLTLDNRTLRDTASAAPYEFIEILVNERTYGGGGIFNDQATASVDSAFSEYVFVHEFGHHFAALADEYYTSDVAYDTSAAPKLEPWEPNVTALLDRPSLKWGDLVTPGTPLPTPWPKEVFEQHSMEIQARRREIRKRNAPEAEMDALFREQQAFEEKLLKSGPHGSAVGAFEGGNYQARGLYRLAGRLHHVHAQPRGFLRGVPAGNQPDHRSVFEMIADPRQPNESRGQPTIGRRPAEVSASIVGQSAVIERNGDGEAAGGQAGRGDQHVIRPLRLQRIQQLPAR